jgi:predicted O-linked N-acetylglucosamine transferase (SPINDLY family)
MDLKVHSDGNRLLALAHKPAPVQATWLGYPGTTGMQAMDYRISDPYLDPSDKLYVEKTVRLPETFWCYDPIGLEPAIGPLPSIEMGFITFGCLNSINKADERMLALWARVLGSVTGSRLMLSAEEGSSRQRVLDSMHQKGIAADRISFSNRVLKPQYMQMFNSMDIFLDTVPYNGHTTCMDAFFMGIPVVTLTGPTVVGRAGVCLAMNLGLPDLIAHDEDQYVRLAVMLAGDRERLSRLRAGLRDQMRNSPLMNAKRFAGHMEAAYRDMWQRWCSSRK